MSGSSYTSNHYRKDRRCPTTCGKLAQVPVPEESLPRSHKKWKKSIIFLMFCCFNVVVDVLIVVFIVIFVTVVVDQPRLRLKADH